MKSWCEVGKRVIAGNEGFDFVRCRICGDHRRVISGRHLSKHEIERETYMAEYRLSADQLVAIDFRRIRSSRRDYHPYRKRDWVSAVKTVYKKIGNVNARYLQLHYPNIYTQGVWLYGDWDNALRAAGFDPETTRQRMSWTKPRVIKTISRLRNRREPLYPQHMIKTHPALFSGALREFGTWSKALRAAGLPEIQTEGTTPLNVLRVMRDIKESRSENEIPAALKLQAEYYFGSFRKAIAESKKDRRVVNGWSKPKILALLSRMHRCGKSLGYSDARRKVPALVSATQVYFGSWGRALQHAGIDPNLYYKRRTPIRGKFQSRRDRSHAEHQF